MFLSVEKVVVGLVWVYCGVMILDGIGVLWFVGDVVVEGVWIVVVLLYGVWDDFELFDGVIEIDVMGLFLVLGFIDMYVYSELVVLSGIVYDVKIW